MRTFNVEIFFPELPSPVATQTAIAQGGKIGTAIKRALDEIRSRPGVKGRKKINMLRITCVEVKKA